MHLIRGLHNLIPCKQAYVATIGNFDGVHIGHQAIFAKLLEKAAVLRLPALVIIFEPQPREYFMANKSPARLTRLREKLLFMQKCGITQVLCLHFEQKLAQLTARDFINSILIDSLNIKYLMVGEDFRFGWQRQGDYKLLQSIAAAQNFEVAAFPTLNYDSQKISSTRVREALQQADLELVSKLLGRSYSMCGRVMHGEKRGRKFGIPTANVLLHRKTSPLLGVFAVQVLGLGTSPVLGVANIGNRPTVNGMDCLLEVHLFDFDRDIYGQNIEVCFMRKLREEQRFDSLELLKKQISCDIAQAKNYFKHSIKV